MSHPPKTRSSSDESGTTSLIFGERFSVRLPRRTVPIWVSDPIGLANPLRTAITPAIVVVLTAPRPTSSTPSLPRAGAMSIGLGMKHKLYQPWTAEALAKAGYDTEDVFSTAKHLPETRQPAPPRRRHDRREDG